MLDGKFCTPCQKKGHVCPAATVHDGIGLCAFCQDEEECPVSKREKEVAARFGRGSVGAGAAAVAPAKVKSVRAPKEVNGEKTMEICVKPNCGKPMSHRGRCANQGNKKHATGSERVPPRKAVSKPANKVQRIAAKPAANGSSNGSAVATICVPEAALDRFWTGLSVEEKAAAFTEYLGRE